GKQALAVLEQRHVDVLLLDAWMPEMDGFDTMWALKSRRTFRDLAIVLMSANLTRDQVAFATRLGARAVLEKPLVPNLVAARIQEVLDARAAAGRANE
ncbi:MAG TPA: response regulator, partial [Thermoanaerobaculia bacterium]|nr:response regulator [Thermoanaerobaculia bacterium]